MEHANSAILGGHARVLLRFPKSEYKPKYLGTYKVLHLAITLSSFAFHTVSLPPHTVGACFACGACAFLPTCLYILRIQEDFM